MTDTDRDFVPALGKSGSLDRYDAAIALMTREKRWRSDLPPRRGRRRHIQKAFKDEGELLEAEKERLTCANS